MHSTSRAVPTMRACGYSSATKGSALSVAKTCSLELAASLALEELAISGRPITSYPSSKAEANAR